MKRKHRVLALLVPLIVLCKAAVAQGAGACCVDGIVCIPGQTEEACGNVGGFFRGTGTTCAPNGRCKGACCVSGDCLEDLSQQACEGLSGVFQGGGTICESEDDLGDNLCAVVFVPHDVSLADDGASSVIAVDLDADGDTDLLSASAHNDTIAWHENLGGSPPSFAARVISTTAQGASSVFATDLDNDGDVDVLSASQDDDKIAWYESDGGSPPAFVTHIITGDRRSSVTGLALPIPDGGFPFFDLSHVLNVTESFSVVDVDIGVQVTHTRVGDLIIQVEHLGTTVTLVNQPGDATDTPGFFTGCPDDNYDIVFDDEGTGGAIEDQCSLNLSSPPSYTPNGALSAFDGADSAGAWTITVYDTAFADTGTLDGWSIRLKGALNEAFADGAASVFAADIDGDGDTDVLSAAPLADTRCSNDPSTRCTGNEDCCVDVVAPLGECDDPDNVCSQTLAWYENDGNTPPGFAPRLIPGDQFGRDARFVVAADMDGDTDIDVVTTSGGGPGEGVCSLDATRACNLETDCKPGVCAPVRECDLDSPNPGETCINDGDCEDTCAQGACSSGTCSNNPSRLCANNSDCKLCVGDPDIICDVHADCLIGLCEDRNECVGTDLPCLNSVDCPFDACILDRAIAWYENTGAADPDLRFNEHVIRSGLGTKVFSPSVADIDDDGFMDIASAADGDVAIAWRENDGVSPPMFAQHFVSSAALSDLAVFAADVDGDGDADIVSASSGRRCGGDTTVPGETCLTAGDCTDTCDQAEGACARNASFSCSNNADCGSNPTCDLQSWVGWHENRGGSPPRFSARIRRITNNVDDARSVFAADVDGDGDMDIISASAGDDKIAWYENQSALKVLNVTSKRNFATIASAVANAADLQVLSAHPDRFDAAEPTIDFRGKGITLQARGDIVQPVGGEYTLADNAKLQSAPGAWNLTLHGTLITPPGAQAQLSTTGAFILGATGTLTAEAGAGLSVDVGAVLQGTTNVGPNATIAFAGDVSIMAGAANVGIGGALTSSGALTATPFTTLSVSGGEVFSAGHLTLAGDTDLNIGSRIQTNGALFALTNSTLLAAGSSVDAAGDVILDGLVSLNLGSTLTAGGTLFVSADNPLTTLTLGPGSGLFIAGDVSFDRPVLLDVDAFIATNGALILEPDSNELTVNSNASISAEGDVTLQSPTSLAFGSALAAGGVLDNTSDLGFVGSGISAAKRLSNRGAIVGFGTIEANVHNFHKALFRADTQVVGDYSNGTPLGLCDDSDPMFEDQECIDDNDCGGGAGACRKLGRCEDGVPCSADSDCTVGTCKRLGRCDDGTLTTDGQVCSVDVDCADTCGQGTCTASECSNNSERPCVDDTDCKLCTADTNVTCNDDTDCGGSNGVCATALCDDASGALAGKTCTTDLECGGGFCVQLGKCDGADPPIIPGQACTGDVQCGTGRCFSGTTIIEQESMLVIIGTLSNFGTIIGDALTRPLLGYAGGDLQIEQPLSAGAAQQPAEQGFFVHGHFVTGATALLLMPLPQSVVRVGGNYTAATNASARYDMAHAELRMVGVGGKAQELEVMSKDIGPIPHGLDRTHTGHYPIGMLRIGPPATTVELVDSHDNDGLGQAAREAIYAKTLVIEPGATLQTNKHMVYYGTLVLNGQVDDPDNLVEIIPAPQDFDLDFDVDLDDYSALDRCVGGPGSGISGGTCTAVQFDQADSDNDNDVDLLDIRKFQLAFTGD